MTKLRVLVLCFCCFTDNSIVLQAQKSFQGFFSGIWKHLLALKMLSSIEGTFSPIQTKNLLYFTLWKACSTGPPLISRLLHISTQGIHKNLVLVCVSVHGGHVTFHFVFPQLFEGHSKRCNSHWSKYFMLWNALFWVIAGHGDSLLVS